MNDDRAQLEELAQSMIRIEPATVNYIATYRAECEDGSYITANLSLMNVPVGTDPDKVIDLVMHRASVDVAGQGFNVKSVTVANLSRVW